MKFKINYFFLILFISGAILLPRESRSNPVENTDRNFIRNILPDADFWLETVQFEKLTTDKDKDKFVDFSVGNNVSKKDGIMSENARIDDMYFYTIDNIKYTDHYSSPCIFCKDVKSTSSKSFAQDSSDSSFELTVNDKYPIFEAKNIIYPDLYFRIGLIEIGFFETLAMIGFGFLMGILKYLRLNNFAMIDVYSRNGDIFGAPVGAPIGTGSVASRPHKTAHRVPLYIPRVPVPDSVAISQRW